jgi:hypothetical protein
MGIAGQLTPAVKLNGSTLHITLAGQRIGRDGNENVCRVRIPREGATRKIPNAKWPYGEKRQWVDASTLKELTHRQEHFITQFEPAQIVNVFDGNRAANKVSRGIAFAPLTFPTIVSTVHTIGRCLQKRNYTPRDTSRLGNNVTNVHPLTTLNCMSKQTQGPHQANQA